LITSSDNAVPDASCDAGIRALRAVGLSYTVVKGTTGGPTIFTTDPDPNLVPKTVTVVAPAPAFPVGGQRAVTVGCW
jgi:hypothetical protein